MVLHVRGTVLPEREERSLWIYGGVLREAPVADAETVADGVWLLPGLVDVHTHPGAEKPGDPSTNRCCAPTSRSMPPRVCC
jgi:imidazolonepropionase-like amidohydrolase